MKRFLGVRQEESHTLIEATFEFTSVIMALTFITMMISPLYFEKILVTWCYAITKYCSKLSSLHNLKNKVKINGIRVVRRKDSLNKMISFTLD